MNDWDTCDRCGCGLVVHTLGWICPECKQIVESDPEFNKQKVRGDDFYIHARGKSS